MGAKISYALVNKEVPGHKYSLKNLNIKEKNCILALLIF